MSLPWFRMYAEFSGDPVVQSLAFEDQRHYVILLCLKCNGTLDRDLPNSRRELIICRGLGLDAMSGAEAKKRLLEVGLIDKSWQPVAWDKRQYKSDVSTDRVRKYRENKETGNVSETAGNSFGNAPDTDTDTDTEQKTTRAEGSANAAPPPFITLTLNTGEEFPIAESQIAEWGALFPAVDVRQELRNMRAWCLSNRTNRKTKAGITRFITSWLTRGQNGARRQGGEVRPRKEAVI